MMTLPVAIPVMRPEAGSMDAIDGLLLAQVPPVAILDNAEVSPRQIFVLPVIGPIGLTVTGIAATQPVAVAV